MGNVGSYNSIVAHHKMPDFGKSTRMEGLRKDICLREKSRIDATSVDANGNAKFVCHSHPVVTIHSPKALSGLTPTAELPPVQLDLDRQPSEAVVRPGRPSFAT